MISGMALLNMSALHAFEIGKADHADITIEREVRLG
jgi:hypothetical protein